MSPGEISTAAVLSDMTEMYFVLEGHGELWRSTGDFEEVVELRPDRCATITPGVPFQYRAPLTPLRFLVASMPAWERDRWHESPVAYWPEGRGTRIGAHARAPWATKDLAEAPDYPAPDTSEIRLLPSVPAGGLAEARLAPGRVAAPVSHRTVEEIWFVIAGEGELWRGDGAQAEVVPLLPGRSITIPRGVAFQFRAHEPDPLRILVVTTPQWPGPQEAISLWMGDVP